ncbi:phage major capsid protein [Salmonella enterica subsp. enterica serovar Baildon]|uniref:phage major capsid protein n=1 Tax=Salmonella enterica TaxID=28901 RepID=UPI0009AD5BFD|nr:phage major capsid protein [Salmonella enterica]EAZ8556512.1 phage major capsid protein [Salmonella enterica]EBQ7783284.1 phage major capsid protein [Salmonella enterica]EBR4746312.1 phage major capsid protein [Salmonella enterica]EDU6072740.1 phage major capsid protein [Salmonella enterica subsp. enterica serovar Baildon]EJH0548864.1 phage major capsid protein [Salmonella enterica]
MKQYRRDLTVSAPAFVESGDDRIVELAFSSEAPYSRIYTDQNGDPVELKEILVHDKDAVDLDVLNDKASLLFNHEFDNHIGVVVPGSARIDEDGVGRALVKFSQVGQLANETYDKVKEGTMSKVSVGYTVLEGHADFSKGVYFVTKWQPYEISIVSVPADSSVGVGRSLNTITDEPANNEENREVEVETEIKPEEEIRSEENKEQEELNNEESNSGTGDRSDRSETVEEEKVTPEETRSEEENKNENSEELNTDTQESDDERQNNTETGEEEKPVEVEKPFKRSQEDTDEIRAIGKHLNISEDEIQRAIEDKEITVESFKQRALNINTESKTFAKGKNNMTDTIKTLENRFDLSAALRSLSQEKALEGAEAEYSQEMARQAAQRGRAQRSNSVFVPTSALAPVVGTEIRHDSFVDLLLEKSVLGALGVNTLTGLTAPISLPRMNKNATDAFGFVNENGEGALSDVAFDGVPMSMKTFTGAVAISRQSMLSMPNVGALVAEHLIKASRIKLEKLILGNEEVANARAGLVKQLIDAGKVVKCGLTHKDFLVEIAKLTDAGVDEAQIALAMRGALAADLASTLRDQAVAGYIMENGKIANRPVHTSGVLAEGAILAGDFSALTIGEWAGLEIDVDTTSLRAKGGTAVRVWADLDWAVSNPDAIRVIQKAEARSK